jgi:hypothetical protein
MGAKSAASFFLQVAARIIKVHTWKVRTPSEFWLYQNPGFVLLYRGLYKKLLRKGIKIPHPIYTMAIFLFQGLWHGLFFGAVFGVWLGIEGFTSMLIAWIGAFAVCGAEVVVWQNIKVLSRVMYRIPRILAVTITITHVGGLFLVTLIYLA